jgi:hypothetical protein
LTKIYTKYLLVIDSYRGKDKVHDWYSSIWAASRQNQHSAFCIQHESTPAYVGFVVMLLIFWFCTFSIEKWVIYLSICPALMCTSIIPMNFLNWSLNSNSFSELINGIQFLMWTYLKYRSSAFFSNSGIPLRNSNIAEINIGDSTAAHSPFCSTLVLMINTPIHNCISP